MKHQKFLKRLLQKSLKAFCVYILSVGIFLFGISINAQSVHANAALNVPFTIQIPNGKWVQPFKDACEEASLLMVDAFYRQKVFKDKQDARKKILTSPVLTNTAAIDADNDGLSKKDEITHGTNLYVADTDGDGFNDGMEVSKGYNPLVVAENKLQKTMLARAGCVKGVLDRGQQKTSCAFARGYGISRLALE